MKALKAYKYRLYPTSKQEEFIQKTFSCVRLVYNLMLQDRIDIYKEMRKNPQQTFKMPTPAKYKKQYPVLREVDSLALANAQVYLDRAFKNFYREKGMGFPKKKKKETVHSYTTNNQHGTVKILDNRYLKVPKLKSLIKMKVHRQQLGEIKSVTISMSASHNYYVSILCEAPIETKTKQQKMVGICSSREKFALLSNGESFEKSYCSKHLKQKLRQEERKLNKRKMIALEKGVDLSQAKNYQKQKIKVAKIREKIANQRTDILNKITTELVSSYDVICIEKAHHSNERPPKHDRSELAWSLFLAKLLYKAQWYGKELICIESEEIETELSFSESTENSEYLRSQKILERGLSKRETL